MPVTTKDAIYGLIPDNDGEKAHPSCNTNEHKLIAMKMWLHKLLKIVVLCRVLSSKWNYLTRFLFASVTAAIIENKVVLDASKREAAKADAVLTFVFESTKKDILG